MTTLTVNIKNEKDLLVVQQTLDALGLAYQANDEDEFGFSEVEIRGFKQADQDFIDGKTTARDWQEIEKDLDSAFN